MLQNEKMQISSGDKIDAGEIAEMARKLPDKEKERFYFMMKGVALMEEAEEAQKAVQTAKGA